MEAARELLRARLLTSIWPRTFCSELGRLSTCEEAVAAAWQEDAAGEIGRIVAGVARGLPIQTRCLQQAIAVRRMLARRKIPAFVSLGVGRTQDARAAADLGRAAHAWVTVGSRVVSGSESLENYAEVARFA